MSICHKAVATPNKMPIITAQEDCCKDVNSGLVGS